MNSLERVITEISDTFLSEAKGSLSLIEDMAAMERYLAESYSGRVFIELIQNADDCGSTRISLCQYGNDLYFANNGTPFTKEDVIAISRSGSSMKKRGETIGYRGIGFKSTTTLSGNIYICSNGSTFTFSKRLAAEKLGLSQDRVPTIRIPFLVEEMDDRLVRNVQRFYQQGYNTVFVFRNANMQEVEAEIRDFTTDFFIFLQHIQECFIDIEGCMTQNYKMQRQHSDDFDRFSIDNITWLSMRSKSAAVAFKEENGKVVSCSEQEAVYHCFLPTLDRCPFGIKCNADFSTDPSRKHLVNDTATEAALTDLSKLICSIIGKLLRGELQSDAQMLSLLRSQKTFSSINLRLTGMLRKHIPEITIELSDGNSIQIAHYKNLPDWLEPQEKELLRCNSKAISADSLPPKIYHDNYQVEEFLAEYSTSAFSNDDLVKLLEEDGLLQKLPQDTVTKLLQKIVKKASLDQRLYGTRTELDRAIRSVKNIDKGSSIIENLTDELSDSEVQYINDNTSVILEKKPDPANLKQEPEPISGSDHPQFTPMSNSVNAKPVRSLKPKVSRWRSAEQRVMQLETYMGNSVRDVSRMNVGYDIESKTPSGETRYIEVKSLVGESAEFSITNNEYTAAHEYGQSYYICLIFESNAIYIQNPLANLSFTKRARQWEWVCDQYTGTSVEFDVE